MAKKRSMTARAARAVLAMKLPEDSELRTMPNVWLFPHMAGPTFDMREKVTLKLIKDIKAILAGEPYEDEIPYDYAIRMTAAK